MRLDIATRLADEILSVDEIARRVSSNPDATYRLLRFLSAMGIFSEPAQRTFKNNKLSAYLREDNPHNIRAMILMHNASEMSVPWYEALESGVRRGAVPFELIHEKELFEYMSDHPGFNSLFARAMDSVESLSGDSFVTDFDWQRFERIIDIGGSRGSKSLSILKRYPHLEALVVDHDEVIKEARAFWDDKVDDAILKRLSFQSGDVTESVPVATSENDIYLLSAVLHSFDDDTCISTLSNIAAAINGSGARIALLETILDELKPDLASTSFDMQMLMGTRGRERTLSEWKSIFAQSGVVLEEVVNLRIYGKILVLGV